MLILKFNSQLFAKDLCEALVDGADQIMEEFLKEASDKMKATDYEIQKSMYDEAIQTIRAGCIFYGHAILESYGSGLKMDDDNDWLGTYFGNTALGWNPLRNSKLIVGRKEGKYINFFGEEAESNGNKAGISVGYKGRDIGKVPRYHIQNAEKALKEQAFQPGGYATAILDDCVKRFFAHTDMSKYFHNEVLGK